MAVVPQIHASEELGAWLASRRTQLDESGVATHFRTSDVASERQGKATVELRCGEDLGYVSLWANGMIDFGVVRSGQVEPQETTRECESVGDIGAVLDACLDEFVGTV
jgi:hypothetical protein